MTQPKLVFSGPNGQSSIQALFDQPMKEGGPADPQLVSNWSVGGGLPPIQTVNRTSNVEFEIVLSSPAPIAGGYTVTVDAQVESQGGERMDPTALTAGPFSITVPDLTVQSATWSSPNVIDVTFSEAIDSLSFSVFSDVVSFTANDYLSSEPPITGVSISGSVLTVTLGSAGTSGASYTLSLVRELFVSQANGTQLLSGQETILTFGQGNHPVIADLSVVEDGLTVTSSEVFGVPYQSSGWPLTAGFYSVDKGDLNADTSITLGSLDSILLADAASFPGLAGQNLTFSVKTGQRSVATGQSWVQIADSVVGAGSETVGATTTLNKLSGAPYEVVFSSGESALANAGRVLSTTLQASFTPSTSVFPLLALTWLNTQTSVVIQKTAANKATALLFKGSRQIGAGSVEFDPTVPFSLDVIDAVPEGGWVSVAIDGVVVLGAPASEMSDPLLEDFSVGQNAVAVTLGSPSSTPEVFSIDFTADLTSESYLGTGLLGVDSRDLLAFSGRSFTDVIGPPSAAPPSPGFQGTGLPAFGVSAIYFESRDAIQVTVAVPSIVAGKLFDGLVELQTVDGNTVDQAVFDQSYLITSYDEVLVIFLHPVIRVPSKVFASVDIDGSTYTATVDVSCEGGVVTNASLTRQPASWS